MLVSHYPLADSVERELIVISRQVEWVDEI